MAFSAIGIFMMKENEPGPELMSLDEMSDVGFRARGETEALEELIDRVRTKYRDELGGLRLNLRRGVYTLESRTEKTFDFEGQQLPFGVLIWEFETNFYVGLPINDKIKVARFSSMSSAARYVNTAFRKLVGKD